MLNKTLKYKSVQKDDRIRKYPEYVPKGEQGQKVKATHQRVQFIRNNMDMSVSEIQERTELARPIISMIKVAEMNDNWKNRDVDQNASLFDELNQEMKDWLRNNEKEQSWRKYGNCFNRKFGYHEITPLDPGTVKKYHRRLQSPANLSKQGEKSS